MTSNEAMLHTKTAHQHIWQILVEFDLSAEPGSEQLAVERVSQAVHRLNWPTGPLQQLKLALAQAARKAAECGCRYDTEGAVAIRVLIPENDPVAQETDQACGESTPLQATEAEAQQVTQSPSRGWGFFMIEKAVPRPDRCDVRYLIEVYLYPEGATRDSNCG